MATYLVTGGAGFIGSHIVAALVDRGETVRVFDNFLTGNPRNLDAVADKIVMIEGDLRSYAEVEAAIDGVDFVLHQGALPSVPRSVQDPLTTNECNVTGTIHVLQASRLASVKRVVVASSSSAYGASKALPKVEDMPTAPISPYAVSKLASEQYAIAFSRTMGIETVALRYFNVFGPRQDPFSQYAAVIPKFISAMRKGEAPVIFGDGSNSRDFTYVDNVVSANLLACTAPNVAGEVFNCACNQRITLDELVAAVNELLGTKIDPTYEEGRAGDVPHSLAAIDKAERMLGYEVVVSFREGLRRLCDWTDQADWS
jgi:nucleoside-diphosphate-sugar epimerase